MSRPTDSQLLGKPTDSHYSLSSEEPDYLENDLEERLCSARNLIDLALLAFNEDRHELIPIAIEELYHKIYLILEDYCIKEE